jgi:hypothetical protein
MFNTINSEFVSNDEFTLRECDENAKASFGIATKIEDQIGRLDVVTHRYNEENYLENIEKIKINLSQDQLLSPELSMNRFKEMLPEAYVKEFDENGILLESDLIKTSNGGLYIDKYSWNSVPIVAKEMDGYTGSARLIISNGEKPLPIFNSPEIKIDESSCLQCAVEISQLAKAHQSHPMVLFGLLRIARMYSRENNIPDWVATIDKKVFNLLNKRIGFDIKQIGPEVDYLGSISIPSYINIANSISSIERVNSTAAKFLDGESNIPGFEWYIGA